MPSASHNESSPHSIPSRTTAILALVGVNALWGLSFPIMKSMNHQLETVLPESQSVANSQVQVAFTAGMIGLRFAIALGLLALMCPRLVFRASRTEWKAGVYVGLFFYFGLVLQVIGLATIPASRSGFLTSLTAVFTPLVSAIAYRKLPSGNVLIGIILALLGVSFLTGLIVPDGMGVRIAEDATQKWTIGDTLTTLGSLLFTGQLLMVDYFGKRLNSAALTPGMFLAVIVVALVTFFGLHRFQPLGGAVGEATQLVSLSQWTALFLHPMFLTLVVVLALFCSVFAFLGMNRFQPAINAIQASVIYSSEPVFASLWALVIPGTLASIDLSYGYANETLSAPLLFGGALILVANVVALWPKKSLA
jgi:drug/metabolite transporter (DMT)-like permease